MRSSQIVEIEQAGVAKILVGVVWTEVAEKGDLSGWKFHVSVGAESVFSVEVGPMRTTPPRSRATCKS
jgi:hypothetical protein